MKLERERITVGSTNNSRNTNLLRIQESEGILSCYSSTQCSEATYADGFISFLPQEFITFPPKHLLHISAVMRKRTMEQKVNAVDPAPLAFKSLHSLSLINNSNEMAAFDIEYMYKRGIVLCTNHYVLNK